MKFHKEVYKVSENFYGSIYFTEKINFFKCQFITEGRKTDFFYDCEVCYEYEKLLFIHRIKTRGAMFMVGMLFKIPLLCLQILIGNNT